MLGVARSNRPRFVPNKIIIIKLVNRIINFDGDVYFMIQFQKRKKKK